MEFAGLVRFRSGMLRRHRTATGGYVSHVLNRAVGRAAIFETNNADAAFEKVFAEAREHVKCVFLPDAKSLAFGVMADR